MEKAEGQIRWALVGASDIAKTRVIQAINAQPDSRVAAVFSSSPQRGKSYADENGIPKTFNDLSELLSDPEIDVVYISTTNELHRDQAVRLLAPANTFFVRSHLLFRSKTLEK